MTFGEILQTKRLLAGMSQADLSKASGIPLPTIKGIEQGVREDPRFSTVQALAAALGCTCHELTLPLPKSKRLTSCLDIHTQEFYLVYNRIPSK